MANKIATFDATVSGAAATTYLTYEKADELSDEYECADLWDAADRVKLERFLIMGTRLIDGFRAGGWGARKDPAQQLCFPRSIDAAVIPVEVERALMEYVNYRLLDTRTELKELQAEGVTNASIGGTNVAMKGDESGLPAESRKQLEKLALANVGETTVKNHELDGSTDPDALFG